MSAGNAFVNVNTADKECLSPRIRKRSLNGSAIVAHPHLVLRSFSCNILGVVSFPIVMPTGVAWTQDRLTTSS